MENQPFTQTPQPQQNNQKPLFPVLGYVFKIIAVLILNLAAMIAWLLFVWGLVAEQTNFVDKFSLDVGLWADTGLYFIGGVVFQVIWYFIAGYVGKFLAYDKQKVHKFNKAILIIGIIFSVLLVLLVRAVIIGLGTAAGNGWAAAG